MDHEELDLTLTKDHRYGSGESKEQDDYKGRSMMHDCNRALHVDNLLLAETSPVGYIVFIITFPLIRALHLS